MVTTTAKVSQITLYICTCVGMTPQKSHEKFTMNQMFLGVSWGEGVETDTFEKQKHSQEIPHL